MMPLANIDPSLTEQRRLVLSLPAHETWIVLLLLGIIAGSVLVFVLTGDRRRAALPDKWHLPALAGFATVLTPIWIGIIGFAVWSLIKLAANFPDVRTPEDIRWSILAFVGLVTALGGLVGAPLALIRVYTTERATTATEEGLITERINKAVANLGADKEAWEGDEQRIVPNMEVRLGGIFALERIAQDSARDHVQVMEILCAYIRENAPASGAQGSWNRSVSAGKEALEPDVDDKEELAFQAGERAQAKTGIHSRLLAIETHHWAANLPPPRTDIQSALEIIGRRPPDQIEKERATPHRGSTVGYVLDLRATNLRRYDLSELDFRHAKLAKSHLEGADLGRAHLEGADFKDTHLEGAHLGGAHLEGAHLVGAHLEGTNLAGAHLEGASLEVAHLEGAGLVGAHLDGANLWGAHLEGAALVGAHLGGANFGGAHLEGAHLVGAHLEGADLRETHLEGAHLVGAHLDGADLRETHLEGASLVGAHLEGADLRETHLEGAHLGRAHLEGADLRETHLEGAFLVGAHLGGANLGGAHLEGAHLVGAHLDGANLGGAHLEGAHLVGAHLDGANLWSAHLDASTVFSPATLRGAGLKTVDFTIIPKLRVDFSESFGDASVKLPPDVKRPDHWSKEDLDWGDFYDQWRAFQAKIGYTPP